MINVSNFKLRKRVICDVVFLSNPVLIIYSYKYFLQYENGIPC